MADRETNSNGESDDGSNEVKRRPPPVEADGDPGRSGQDTGGDPAVAEPPSRPPEASVRERTRGNHGEIRVDEDFLAINNMWTTTDVTQSTYLYDDGSYGWEWHRGDTGLRDPNYPQALVGTKPWGTDTGTQGFPIRREEITEFEGALEVDTTVSGDEWNLMQEWWLTEDEPADGRDVSDSITHEISLVLEWGSRHSPHHGDPIDRDAVVDAYGNQVDYWRQIDIGWDFRIFRIAANETPARIDYASIVEYVSEQLDVEDALWLSGIEIGNEYWDHTGGTTTFNRFEVTLNDRTYTSGIDSDW